MPGNIYLEQLPAGQDQLPAPYRAHLATLAIVPVPPGVSLDAIWQATRPTPLRNRNRSLSLSPRGFHHTPGERRMSRLASADSSPDVTTGCSYICRAWNFPKAVSRTDASG